MQNLSIRFVKDAKFVSWKVNITTGIFPENCGTKLLWKWKSQISRRNIMSFIEELSNCNSSGCNNVITNVGVPHFGPMRE